MKLIYTDHLKTRLAQRRISINIVKKIFEKSEVSYWDNLRSHHIIVSNVTYKGKQRKVLAAYDKIEDNIEVVTIHPITGVQIKQRLNSGRWIYEKETN